MNPAPDRVSRPVAGDGPIEDVNSIDLQCGGWSAGGVVGSAPAKLHAAAEAGSTVKLRWTIWPDSHVGPMITYLARCPVIGCRAWETAEEAVFFKIQEEGRQSSTSNKWGSTPLMTEGYEYEYTIPACLQPGYYLVHHETIALHAAFAYPGVQFYPNCHQLKITGLGTAVPTDLVSFPGGYASDDPGVTFNAYLPTVKESDDAARVAEAGCENWGAASNPSSCINVARTMEPATSLKDQMMRVIDVMASPKVLVANEAHVGTDSTAPLERQSSAIHSKRGPIKIMRQTPFTESGGLSAGPRAVSRWRCEL
ncbi:Cellulose-growth-specific protein like [Verticillium longisporum]|nr:Cellulose-growth-specific protein like [Verticillium longisporum]